MSIAKYWVPFSIDSIFIDDILDWYTVDKRARGIVRVRISYGGESKTESEREN